MHTLGVPDVSKLLEHARKEAEAGESFLEFRLDYIEQPAQGRRDRSGGKSELALQQFGDYVKYYGDTDLAPNAQYYIGEIHFSQGELESALREFDLVLEKYPDNSKTPDALYMKGVTLVKMGKRTQGAQEFQELAKRFPSNTLATKACTQLKEMGLRCPTATAVRRNSKR